jgi:hypothetical protein
MTSYIIATQCHSGSNLLVTFEKLVVGLLHQSSSVSSQLKPAQRRLYRPVFHSQDLHIYPFAGTYNSNFRRIVMALLNDTLAPYLAGVVAAALVFSVLKQQTSRRSLPLPPGPKPLPLIGNLLDIPKSMVWLTYQTWSKRYGDIVYVEALGQRIVILGSATAVNDLMERRGSIYSDRPRAIMLNELYVRHHLYCWLGLMRL